MEQKACLPRVQVVGALQLQGFTAALQPPESIRDVQDKRAVSALLVRWFVAHPSANMRDCKCRPVCEGPLGVNHCKYVWARTTQERPCIRTNTSWSHALNVLHLREGERAARRADLAYARYELQQPGTVEAYVSMNPQREWDPRARRWGPVTSFLETVVIP